MVAKMDTADHCRKRATNALESEAACLNATLRGEWSMIAQEWTSFAIMMELREAPRSAI
jgi:hypothetical protein